jgi:hypothetical protein
MVHRETPLPFRHWFIENSARSHHRSQAPAHHRLIIVLFLNSRQLLVPVASCGVLLFSLAMYRVILAEPHFDSTNPAAK